MGIYDYDQRRQQQQPSFARAWGRGEVFQPDGGSSSAHAAMFIGATMVAMEIFETETKVGSRTEDDDVLAEVALLSSDSFGHDDAIRPRDKVIKRVPRLTHMYHC